MFFALPGSALSGGRLVVDDRDLAPYGYRPLNGPFEEAAGPGSCPRIERR
ncbi:hypothetical protein [Actinoplanes sp. NBRC 103695]|nr:hypothetical protein [Actinoplanes sp. NBRC 103695]